MGKSRVERVSSEDKPGYALPGREKLVSVLKKISGAFWDLVAKPEYMVVVFGFVFGLLLLVTTPPSLVCDEPMHLYNAYRLSQGRLLPPECKGTAGNYVPKSFAKTSIVTGSADLICHTDGKQDVNLTLKAFDIPLRAGDTRFVKSYLQYPPLSYLPQSLGMAIGRLFRAPPIMLMYLARLFNLLAALLLAFITIRIAPILKWAFFLMFLMPSTLFIIASSSADCMTIAVSFLAVAFLLKLALDSGKETIDKQDLVYLALIALALSLVKAPYFLLFFAFFLIPIKKFGCMKKYLLTFGIMFLGIVIIAGSWQFLAGRHVTGMLVPGISPFQQLEHIAGHPVSYARLVWSTMVHYRFYVGYYKDSLNMIAGMSWGTTALPTWIPYLFLFSAISVAALDKNENRVAPWQKAYSLLVFVVVELSVVTALYVTFSTVGSAVLGPHGRYFIPALGLLFIPFYNRSIIYEKSRLFFVVVCTLGALFSYTAFHMILTRYY